MIRCLTKPMRTYEQPWLYPSRIDDGGRLFSAFNDRCIWFL